MNQNYGCNTQEGHWVCEDKSPIAPLSPELVKAYYEANKNTNAFTDVDRAKLYSGIPGKDGKPGKDGIDGINGINGILPADKQKLDYLDITQAVDLDTIERRITVVDERTDDFISIPGHPGAVHEIDKVDHVSISVPLVREGVQVIPPKLVDALQSKEFITIGTAVKAIQDAQIPANPTADGEYKLKVVSGVATWVTI